MAGRFRLHSIASSKRPKYDLVLTATCTNDLAEEATEAQSITLGLECGQFAETPALVCTSKAIRKRRGPLMNRTDRCRRGAHQRPVCAAFSAYCASTNHSGLELVCQSRANTDDWLADESFGKFGHRAFGRFGQAI